MQKIETLDDFANAARTMLDAYEQASFEFANNSSRLEAALDAGGADREACEAIFERMLAACMKRIEEYKPPEQPSA